MPCKKHNDRIIIHCDINGHFAYSELLYYPRLLQVPFVVGGNERNRHGIVLSKNQSAKQYPIGTGSSLARARQICPKLVSHPPNYALFSRTSDDFFAYMDQFTDIVAAFGCDGVSIDVTGSAHLFGGVEPIVKALHERFPKEYGLNLSDGVSWNFPFAKLACDTAGPCGVKWITREGKYDTEWQQIVFPTPVEELLYVGEATKKKLWAKGEHTIGDLVQCGPETLQQWFGKSGLGLYINAAGLDTSPLVDKDGGPAMHSIGNGTTTPYDMTKPEQVHVLVHVLASSVCERMRRHRVVPRTVEVSVTYQKDGDLRYLSFQCPMPVPSNIDTEFASVALDLLDKRFNISHPIRHLTVRGKELMFNVSVYQTTFEMDAQSREDKMKLLACKDELNARWKHTLRRAVELADPLLTGLGSKPNQQFAPSGWY